MALSCDRENVKAVELNAAATTSAAQDLQKKWAKLAERQILPLENLALAAMLWLAISLAILWLAPFVLRNTGLPEREDRPSARPLGIGLVLLGAISGTFLAAQSGITPALGVMLTAIGLALWDNTRRGQLRLAVTVAGDEDAHSASNLRGIIADMGSALPRGVEVPVGPDVTALKDVDFTVFGAGNVVNALKVLLMLVKPYAPWELAINVVNDGRLAVVVRRNNEQFASEIIDRTSLGLDAQSLAQQTTGGAAGKPTARSKEENAKDADTSVAMWPFAAALMLTQMAAKHQFDGLGGATNSRSIALHHIATTQFRHTPTEIGLLARSVDLDPGNTPAAIAFWNALYRESTDTDDLKHYVALLKGVPTRLGVTESYSLGPANTDVVRETLTAAVELLDGGPAVLGPDDRGAELGLKLDALLDELGAPGEVTTFTARAMTGLRGTLDELRSYLVVPRAIEEIFDSEDLEPATGSVGAQLGALKDQLTRVGNLNTRLANANRVLPTPSRVADAKEAGLLLRAQYSLIATYINLAYLGHGTFAEVHDAWASLSEELTVVLHDPGHRAHELAVTMRPRVDVAGQSIMKLTALDSAFADVQATGGGPQMHYAAACALIQWGPGSGSKGKILDSVARIAVRHLKIADLNPHLKAFRSKDPQLVALRTRTAYLDAFGEKVEDDLLAIEPFLTYARLLRSLGLNNAESIARTSPGYLVSLGMPAGVAARMIRASDLAVAVAGRGLKEWQVPITDFLQQQNIWRVGPDVVPVFEELTKALQALASRPERAKLEALCGPSSESD
ncbi:MAG: hypothetical protein ACOH1Y_00365 [Propionicimonas sp.]